MLRSLSLNSFKRIRLIISILVFILYLIIFFNPYEVYEMILETFAIIAVMVHCICAIYLLVARSSSKYEKVFDDEMSRLNEGRAADLAIHIAMCAIMVTSVIISLAHMEIVLNSSVAYCAYMGIFALYDGFYLFIDRRGMKHAGTDDED